MIQQHPIAVHQQAIELTGAAIQLTRQLKDSLSDERTALENQDADAVEHAANGKSALIERLQQKDNVRVQLCVSQGFDKGDRQMQQLIDWCDSDNTLQAMWDELLQLAGDCRAMNITNGAIIRLRQQHFASSLAVLTGNQPDRETYTSHGGTSVSVERRAIATA